ncbi:MAG: hypothetical protein GY899_08030 [Verrucomicrobiaceae bacterium]|nr:hypothetical protein [Verrucomicrobiaceae bacterium]
MNTSHNQGIRRVSILALTLSLLCPCVFSRDKPAALQTLEDDFKKDLSATIATLYEPYHDALRKLYDKQIKSGKLNQALAVKMEIERLEIAHSAHAVKQITPVAIPGENGTYLLLPSNAALTGSVHHDGPSKKLIGWKDTGSAKWKLDNLPPGIYHATLHFHSGPFAGGRLQVKAGETIDVFTIKGSGKWKEKKEMPIGEINVPTPSGAFTLSILNSRSQGIMELSSVILTPEIDSEVTE